MAASRQCCICSEAADYRCPKCRLRYCGVDCFRAHKAQCEAAGKLASEQAPVSAKPACTPPLPSGPVDEEDDAYRVTLSDAQLHKLHQSAGVVQALRDSRLRKLLTAIDTAPDREAALERARVQDEHFRVFIDTMLNAVGYAEPVTGGRVGAHELPEGYTAYQFSG